MKQLSVSVATQTDKGIYQLFLGNGARIEFSSKRSAEAFAADTSRFLQDCLFEVNTFLSVIYSLYRQHWLF
ncbi:hypothetical protein [Solitalea lacus]|uniref:hypothetical protein n=1 Tax=Solitalea lacus TaxID=2911172 RepID=UPI001EDA5D01|nr:hypothetical protein [Solitalea lacus]UKJ06315.1 hypothetical protein L2B55_12290 [Solitalea lacus]